MSQPLAGVRVLELATGVAGPYAGKLFADFGADVIKVEPAEGDDSRRWGPFVNDSEDIESSALFLHLNTNKRSIVLDLPTPQAIAQLHDLLSRVDVCIESLDPGTLEAWGLGFNVLHELNPSLVLVSITPFGQSGPYVNYRGSELVYSAFGGLNFTRDPHGKPIMLGGYLTQYHAGNLAAAMTMAALLHAENGDGGTHLDVSIMNAEAGSADGSVVYLAGHAFTGRLSTPTLSQGGATGLGPFPNGTFMCSDGLVTVSTLPQWVAGMQKTVNDADLDGILADPALLTQPDSAVHIREIVANWFTGRTKREAMIEAQANRWPVTAIQDPGELESDPHFLARQTMQTVVHPTVGELAQLTQPFRMDGAWLYRRHAPRLGEHTAEVLAEIASTKPLKESATNATAVTGGSSRLPLEGLRVLDMTVAWSGPFATMLLADLGAEVIRVENPWLFPTATRGVFPRPTKEAVESASNLFMSGYPDLDPGDRPWNRSSTFSWHARNKRSMTLDLRKESGREIFVKLVECSDVLVENNSPNTLDNLGLGYSELAQHNPEFIALRMPSCGLSGPYRDFIGFGGSFEGLAGLRSIRGLPGGTPDEAASSLHMDAAGGTTGAFAVLTALRARRRGRQGALLELGQTENLAHHIGEIVMAAARGRATEPSGNRDLNHAPQGVYPTLGEDRWVAISVDSDAAWAGLIRAMGQPAWADARRFGTAAQRRQDHDEIDEYISEWTTSRDRYEIFASCQAEGVASAPVTDEKDLYADPQLRHREYFKEMSSQHTGRHEYPGHMVRWTGPTLRWDRAAPGLGEDNDYVYQIVLNVSDDEYAKLNAEGHISEDYLDKAGNPL